jgi:hypothetical protein
MKPHDDSASANERMIQAAAGMEAAGVMTQADYLRLARLGNEATAGHGNLSDADLDWALTLLASSTEVAARSRVMVTLAEFARRSLLSSAQKERIAAAVGPYAKSEHKLDQFSAAHCEDSLHEV